MTNNKKLGDADPRAEADNSASGSYAKHQIVRPGSGSYAKQRARSSARSEAHSEMLRAVERGLCTILADDVDPNGSERQWSAWLQPDGTLDICCWRHVENVGWTRGESVDIDVNGVAGLAQLLDRHGL